MREDEISVAVAYSENTQSELLYVTKIKVYLFRLVQNI